MDQKRNAKRWLQEVVDRLPARRVFIDAGAGNGEVTKAFVGAFKRTIAIEPNVYLLNQLQQSLPTVEVLGLPILAAQPAAQGDLVLCSHTFLLHSSGGVVGAPRTSRILDGAHRRHYRGATAPGERMHEYGAPLFRPPV